MRCSKIAVFITFIFVACPPLSSQQDATNSSDDLASANALANDLSQLIINDSLLLTYFFEELNIVDYQQAKLIRLVEKTRKERQNLVADWLEEREMRREREERGKEKRDSRSNLPYEKLTRKFAKEIKEILLPEQLADLRCLTRQRSALISMNGAEGFLLPLFVATELGLTKQQIANLTNQLQDVVPKFEKEKRALAKESWNEIAKLMPDQSADSLIELATLAPGVQRLEHSKRLRMTDFKDWDSDDFQKFETTRYHLAAVAAVAHEPLKNALNILDFQVDEFQLIFKEFEKRQIASSFVEPVMAQLILSTPSGRLTKLKADTRKQLAKLEELYAERARQIESKVLLPAQNEKVKKLAKFIRWMYETKMNDEFGIVIAWSKTFDDKGFDAVSFTKLVEKSRTRYYKKLGEMRKSMCEEVLAGLPKESREKYRQLFGKPYDYEAEKIQSWDDLRAP